MPNELNPSYIWMHFFLGVTIEWVTAPPSTVKQYTVFNVTYRFSVTSDFYTWAVGLGRFVDTASGLNQT